MHLLMERPRHGLCAATLVPNEVAYASACASFPSLRDTPSTILRAQAFRTEASTRAETLALPSLRDRAGTSACLRARPSARVSSRGGPTRPPRRSRRRAAAAPSAASSAVVPDRVRNTAETAPACTAAAWWQAATGEVPSAAGLSPAHRVHT